MQGFNIDEILEMAEQIERNGGTFYRRAAELAEDEAVRQMLLELAAMEDDHEKTFASMRTEAQAAFDLDDQAAQYLQAVADGHVFDVREDPTEVLAGGVDVVAILKHASGREKDAIAYFSGLKAAMPEGWGRDRLDEIIREELSHIALLSKELHKARG